MDEETGIFKLIPIANTQQRSIFDADFQQQDKAGESEGEESAGSNAIGDISCKDQLRGRVFRCCRGRIVPEK